MLSGHCAGEATTCLQLGRDPYSSRGPGHPPNGFECFYCGSFLVNTVPLSVSVPGSVGSAAHTGFCTLGSHRAGALWQRHSLCQSKHRMGTCMETLCMFWGGQAIFIYLLVCSALL